MLLLSFCVLTACASTTLQFFGCSRYDVGDHAPTGDGGAWEPREDALWTLNADVSVECYKPRYRGWSWYVVLMIMVYPIGVPLLYFVTLWRLRRLLNPKEADLSREARLADDDDPFGILDGSQHS